MNRLCKCGCGAEILSEKAKFLHGHHRRGKIHTEETKRSISTASIGKVVSKETRKKLSQYEPWNKGIKLSDDIKRKISENHSRPLLGKLVSKDTREKLSKYTPWNKGKKYSEEECKKFKDINKGRKASEKTKLKLRISKIKYLEIQKLNGNSLYPTIGKIEQLCLDELQKYIKYKIIRNDNNISKMIGRFPDGHIPEVKLFIQFDEYFHFLDSDCTQYKQDDINCTLQLASLGYIVFRISEKKWNDNKEKIIKDFLALFKVEETNI